MEHVLKLNFRRPIALAAALAVILAVVAWSRRAGESTHDAPPLAYHFVVAPGQDPSRLRLDLTGVAMVELDRTGELILHLGPSIVRQPPPRARQDAAHGGHDVLARFRMTEDGQVGFAVGAYDRQRPLDISSANAPEGK